MSFFNFSGIRSPPSRIMPQPSNVSPFCTSPTQLEETLDPNSSIFPGGVQSPSRGFSVKEYEEELNKLSKENFSLKLRIYFLEERIGKITGPHDVEQAVKNNIELKVENEAFRKEIKEKDDLLYQAVKALDLVEEEHKKQEEKHARELSKLQDQVVTLEKELMCVQNDAMSKRVDDGDGDACPKKVYKDSACQFSETVVLFAEKSKTEKEIQRLQSKIEELENEVHDLEGSLEEERDRSARLECEYYEAECASCRDLRDELRTNNENVTTLTRIVDEKQSTIEQQSKICAEMESLLKLQIEKVEQMKQTTRERDETIAALRRQVDETRASGDARVADLDGKIAHLEEEKRTACKAIQSFMVRTKAMSRQVKELKGELKNKDKEVKALIEAKENRSGVGDPVATSKGRGSSVSPNKSPATTRTSMSSTSATSVLSADKEHSWRGPDVSGDNGELSAVDPTAANDDMRQNTETSKRIQDLLETIQAKEEQLRRYENDITLKKAEIDSKDNRIVELETEVEILKTKVASIEASGTYSTDDEKQDSSEKTAEEWLKEIDVKNKEIERLEAELRKRTVNLQEIVNKELWDKNREIERLQKRLRDVATGVKEAESPTKEPCRSFFAKNNTAPSSDFFGLRERLKAARDESSVKCKTGETATENKAADEFESLVVRNLRSELAEREHESERLLHERRDILDVCNMLRTRLEELALFLDSLLSHETVTDLLGKDRRRMIKSAIDRSLDLSRTLSMSISLNPNQSLLELSSLSELLNSTGQGLGNFSTLVLPEEDEIPRGRHVAHFSIVPTDVTLTYDSHLRAQRNDLNSGTTLVDPQEVIAEQARTIDGLKSQLDDAKREIATLQETDRLECLVERGPCEADDSNRRSEVQEKNSEALKIQNSHVLVVDERSESEAWSEPDRNVSFARIGLADDVTKLSPTGNGPVNRSRSFKYDRNADKSSESTGDDQKTSRSPPKRHSEERSSSSRRNLFSNGGSGRRSVSILQEQVQSMSAQLKQKDDEIVAMQCSILELENRLKDERIQLMQQFDDLKAQKSEAERFVKHAEEKVTIAELKKHETERQFVELEAMVTDLVKQREACGIDAANNVKNAMKKIESLEKQRDDALEEARLAKENTDRALVNVRITEMKYEALEDSYRMIEHEVKIKYDAEMRERLKEFEQSCESRFEMLTSDLATKCKQLEEAGIELKTVTELQCASKQTLEEKIEQLEKAHVEIAGLKECIEELQSVVATLKDRESELDKRLASVKEANYRVVDDLSRELEEVKRYANVERDRLLGEKACLENEVARLEKTCFEMCATRDDTEVESKIGPTDERQRAELELRISELENQNAELHNRLVKLQSVRQRQQSFWSRSVQTSPQKMFDVGTSPVANRKVSPRMSLPAYGPGNGDTRSSYAHRGDMSGYTSEESPVGGYEANVAAESPVDEIALPIWYDRSRSAADEDRERTVNSSPDLGIESDQGRFSSLETNVNMPSVRPLLQPIEITHSVHSMLEAATAANAKDDKALDVYDNAERQRWQQLDPHKLHDENVELKRKLLRMKRALENTVDQLNKANEQKKRMEKEVRDEVLKTSLVLRKARANLDSGSETEIMKAA